MSFVYPSFLWALSLLTIPILIHLYNFRKYKTLYFSSLQFVKKIEEESKSTRNIKHLLILIARCLFIIFAVLAFAQPYLPVNKSTEKGGNPVLAIYIDNSFSMAQKGTEGELISEARETAKRLVKDASNDTRFLLVSNEMSGIEQRIVNRLEALDRIDKITLSPLVRTVGEVLNWQRGFVEKYDKEKERVNSAQYVILSDFQKNSFGADKMSEDKTSYFYPIQFVPQNSDNVSIDSLWFSEPNSKIGGTNELNISVKNYGRNDLINAEIQVIIGNIKKDIFVDIPSNQTVKTSFTYIESGDGNKFRSGKASIKDKQVYFDDDYYFTYLPSKECKILIIDGPNAQANVQAVYELDKYYFPKTIAQNAFTSGDLKDIDLVVLNGVNAFSSGFSQDLEEFKKTQGSLILFPGTELNINSYNLLARKVGWPSIFGRMNDGTKIKSIEYNDLFFKPVFEKIPSQLNLPSISTLYQTVKNGGTTIQLITAQNGQSIFSSSLDRRAFVFCSSLDKSYSSFTSSALFTALLLRTGELSNKPIPLYLTIGSNNRYPLYGLNTSEKPIKIKSDQIDFIPFKEKIGAVDYLSIKGNEATERLSAGNYDIFVDAKVGALSLNYDRKESELKTLSLIEVESQWKEKGIENIRTTSIQNGQSLAKLDLEKPFEYWRWMILLSILFLLVEIALLKLWKN
jgi:hypothetical protein